MLKKETPLDIQDDETVKVVYKAEDTKLVQKQQISPEKQVLLNTESVNNHLPQTEQVTHRIEPQQKQHQYNSQIVLQEPNNSMPQQLPENNQVNISQVIQKDIVAYPDSTHNDETTIKGALNQNQFEFFSNSQNDQQDITSGQIGESNTVGAKAHQTQILSQEHTFNNNETQNIPTEKLNLPPQDHGRNMTKKQVQSEDPKNIYSNKKNKTQLNQLQPTDSEQQYIPYSNETTLIPIQNSQQQNQNQPELIAIRPSNNNEDTGNTISTTKHQQINTNTHQKNSLEPVTTEQSVTVKVEGGIDLNGQSIKQVHSTSQMEKSIEQSESKEASQIIQNHNHKEDFNLQSKPSGSIVNLQSSQQQYSDHYSKNDGSVYHPKEDMYNKSQQNVKEQYKISIQSESNKGSVQQKQKISSGHSSIRAKVEGINPFDGGTIETQTQINDNKMLGTSQQNGQKDQLKQDQYSNFDTSSIAQYTQYQAYNNFDENQIKLTDNGLKKKLKPGLSNHHQSMTNSKINLNSNESDAQTVIHNQSQYNAKPQPHNIVLIQNQKSEKGIGKKKLSQQNPRQQKTVPSQLGKIKRASHQKSEVDKMSKTQYTHTTHKDPQLSHNLGYHDHGNQANISERQMQEDDNLLDDDKTQLTFGHQLTETHSMINGEQSMNSEQMRKYQELDNSLNQSINLRQEKEKESFENAKNQVQEILHQQNNDTERVNSDDQSMVSMIIHFGHKKEQAQPQEGAEKSHIYKGDSFKFGKSVDIDDPTNMIPQLSQFNPNDSNIETSKPTTGNKKKRSKKDSLAENVYDDGKKKAGYISKDHSNDSKQYQASLQDHDYEYKFNHDVKSSNLNQQNGIDESAQSVLKSLLDHDYEHKYNLDLKSLHNQFSPKSDAYSHLINKNLNSSQPMDSERQQEEQDRLMICGQLLDFMISVTEFNEDKRKKHQDIEILDQVNQSLQQTNINENDDNELDQLEQQVEEMTNKKNIDIVADNTFLDVDKIVELDSAAENSQLDTQSNVNKNQSHENTQKDTLSNNNNNERFVSSQISKNKQSGRTSSNIKIEQDYKQVNDQDTRQSSQKQLHSKYAQEDVNVLYESTDEIERLPNGQLKKRNSKDSQKKENNIFESNLKQQKQDLESANKLSIEQPIQNFSLNIAPKQKSPHKLKKSPKAIGSPSQQHSKQVTSGGLSPRLKNSPFGKEYDVSPRVYAQDDLVKKLSDDFPVEDQDHYARSKFTVSQAKKKKYKRKYICNSQEPNEDENQHSIDQQQNSIELPVTRKARKSKNRSKQDKHQQQEKSKSQLQKEQQLTSIPGREQYRMLVMQQRQMPNVVSDYVKKAKNRLDKLTQQQVHNTLGQQVMGGSQLQNVDTILSQNRKIADQFGIQEKKKMKAISQLQDHLLMRQVKDFQQRSNHGNSKGSQDRQEQQYQHTDEDLGKGLMMQQEAIVDDNFDLQNFIKMYNLQVPTKYFQQKSSRHNIHQQINQNNNTQRAGAQEEAFLSLRNSQAIQPPMSKQSHSNNISMDFKHQFYQNNLIQGSKRYQNGELRQNNVLASSHDFQDGGHFPQVNRNQSMNRLRQSHDARNQHLQNQNDVNIFASLSNNFNSQQFMTQGSNNQGHRGENNLSGFEPNSIASLLSEEIIDINETYKLIKHIRSYYGIVNSQSNIPDHVMDEKIKWKEVVKFLEKNPRVLMQMIPTTNSSSRKYSLNPNSNNTQEFYEKRINYYSQKGKHFKGKPSRYANNATADNLTSGPLFYHSHGSSTNNQDNQNIQQSKDRMNLLLSKNHMMRDRNFSTNTHDYHVGNSTNSGHKNQPFSLKSQAGLQNSHTTNYPYDNMLMENQFQVIYPQTQQNFFNKRQQNPQHSYPHQNNNFVDSQNNLQQPPYVDAIQNHQEVRRSGVDQFNKKNLMNNNNNNIVLLPNAQKGNVQPQKLVFDPAFSSPEGNMINNKSPKVFQQQNNQNELETFNPIQKGDQMSQKQQQQESKFRSTNRSGERLGSKGHQSKKNKILAFSKKQESAGSVDNQQNIHNQRPFTNSQYNDEIYTNQPSQYAQISDILSNGTSIQCKLETALQESGQIKAKQQEVDQERKKMQLEKLKIEKQMRKIEAREQLFHTQQKLEQQKKTFSSNKNKMQQEQNEINRMKAALEQKQKAFDQYYTNKYQRSHEWIQVYHDKLPSSRNSSISQGSREPLPNNAAITQIQSDPAQLQHQHQGMPQQPEQLFEIQPKTQSMFESQQRSPSQEHSNAQKGKRADKAQQILMDADQQKKVSLQSHSSQGGQPAKNIEIQDQKYQNQDLKEEEQSREDTTNQKQQNQSQQNIHRQSSMMQMQKSPQSSLNTFKSRSNNGNSQLFDWYDSKIMEEVKTGVSYFDESDQFYSEEDIEVIMNKTQANEIDYDSPDILQQIYNQSFATLRELMFQMNLTQLYSKIHNSYKDVNYENTLKLLVRCRQMYQARNLTCDTLSDITQFEKLASAIKTNIELQLDGSLSDEQLQQLKVLMGDLVGLTQDTKSKIIQLRDEFKIFSKISATSTKGQQVQNIFVYKRKDGLKRIVKEYEQIRKLSNLIDNMEKMPLIDCE